MFIASGTTSMTRHSMAFATGVSWFKLTIHKHRLSSNDQNKEPNKQLAKHQTVKENEPLKASKNIFLRLINKNWMPCSKAAGLAPPSWASASNAFKSITFLQHQVLTQTLFNEISCRSTQRDPMYIFSLY